MGLLDFKSPRERDEWCSGELNPLLGRIILEAAQFNASVLKRPPLVITSIWRSAAEDEALGGHGIHPLWRAVDVSADSWSDKYMAAIATYIDSHWAYDKLRPNMHVALFEPHGTGPHCHFQVHFGTGAR